MYLWRKSYFSFTFFTFVINTQHLISSLYYYFLKTIDIIYLKYSCLNHFSISVYSSYFLRFIFLKSNVFIIQFCCSSSFNFSLSLKNIPNHSPALLSSYRTYFLSSKAFSCQVIVLNFYKEFPLFGTFFKKTSFIYF